MADKRADTIYMAKVQEQTERYDGLKYFVAKVYFQIFYNFKSYKCYNFELQL